MPVVKLKYDSDRVWTSVSLPGSKSIAARALIARFVYDADLELINLPHCDDTIELKRAIDRLTEACPDAAERIRRYGEVAPVELAFNLGNGGTSLRFFLALAASVPGLVAEIDCSDSLRRRPLAPLIDALRRHGAEITCLRADGYAPLRVYGRRLHGGKPQVDGSVSSQFLSALMLASPLWDSPLQLDDAAPMVSRPYVEMTEGVMERIRECTDRFVIESDWSAASYMYEMALAVPGRPLIINSLTLPEHSLQGDAMCAQLFGWVGVDTERLDKDSDGSVRLVGRAEIVKKMRKLGVPVTFDLGATPDLVPALAAGLCMAGLPFDFGNIAHLKHKESDRLMALSAELGKAGFAVSAGDSSLSWSGRRYPVAEDETFEAWNDHRIAMALAPLATRFRYLGIEGGEVVSKSFSHYYDQLRHLGFTR